ncbi:sulfite exporter TauE/SafE family protein [Actinokineospora guangxiensis]|uniref:Probable membrane transporter protein n=1 Tax=Actinokineospora guangxiensis TaxID=1490288 RepID=A0ABW0ENP3_9PSEU
MSWTVLLAAGGIVLIGAVVQGAVGYGLNLIAGPLLALLDPVFVPVPILLIACFLAGAYALRELRAVQWHGVGWAMVGRVPGNLLGVLALALLPVSGFNLVIGATVLLCVVLSVLTWRPRVTRPGLVVAGTASGAFGTVSAIGGPPMALLYQNESGPAVRATLNAFFLVASVSSVVTLAVAGQVRGEHLVAGAMLLPFIAVGYLVSGPLRDLLAGPRLRVAVLGVAGASALVLIGRSIL